jgi:hypothetical protein
MKKTFIAMVIAFFVFSPTFLSSNDKFSCEDLGGFVTTLDEVNVALKDSGRIVEGSEVDTSLGELVDALIVVADIENESSLNSSVQNMRKTWENNEWSKFKVALDDTLVSVSRLYLRDCE